MLDILLCNTSSSFCFITDFFGRNYEFVDMHDVIVAEGFSFLLIESDVKSVVNDTLSYVVVIYEFRI